MLIEAARMYYLEGLDQGQVGRRLGLSRSSVSRILASARESGIVQVRIAGDDHISRNRDLEGQLMRTFGLREALVAETSASTTDVKCVAQLGAEVFARRAPSANRIGFSWGFTLGHVVEAIPRLSLHPNILLTPLVGGMPLLDSGPSGYINTQILAEKCGVVSERFDAPAVVESAATQRAMLSESSIRMAIARAAASDLAFVGIGNFGVQTSRRVLEAMNFNDQEMVEVVAAKPVGDVCGRFFTIDGVPLGPPASERVIGITIDQLAGIDIVVGIAAGKTKAAGTLGALRTGAIGILVVDEGLAAAVLALHSRGV
ncbi:sugar-binding transcriptional regulator [Brooklawnia cerclae]